MRHAAKAVARELPVAQEGNQRRAMTFYPFHYRIARIAQGGPPVAGRQVLDRVIKLTTKQRGLSDA